MVLGELVWKITGDDSGFKTTAKKTTKSVKSLGKEFENIDKKAEIFGEQSSALAKKQDVLRRKIEQLVDKGVSPTNKGLKKLTNQYRANQAEIDKTSKKTRNFSSILGKLAAVGVGIKIASFFKDSVKAASDAQETAQKFGVVYDNITGKAIKTAKELAKGYNITTTDAKQLLGSTGNVLKSFQFSQDAALDYSAELVKLGADLTSFTNFSEGSVRATEILTKALLGEREALQALDLKITENDLKALAESQGLVFKELTKQQKAELTLGEIRRQSADAIGDVARSSDSYAFVTRALNNRQKELTLEVGEQLLPSLTELKKAFLDSSNEGGFLYNALIAIGQAAAKVAQALTVALRAYELLNSSVQRGKDLSKVAREEFKKTGGSWVRFNFILLKAGGNGKKAFDLIKKGAAEGDEELQKLAAAIPNIEKRVKQYKDTTGSASEKLSEAIGKLTGSLKNGEKTGVKGFQNIGSAANDASKGISKAKDEAKDFFDLTSKEKFEAISSGFLGVANNVITLISAIDSFFKASAEAQSNRLEQQRQDALEAAGVAEETAVEKAEKELDRAKEAGDKELIQEKEVELKRAKINEDFDKRKAELDYNASLRSWELQLAQARIQQVTAPLNAYVSSLSAPWPLNMILAPINAALAFATATLQASAVQQARPAKPKFAEGGIVPGNLTTGDQVSAQLNSREMVLTQQDQIGLLNQIRGGMVGGQMVHVVVQLDGSVIDEYITEASSDGRILNSDRATIRR